MTTEKTEDNKPKQNRDFERHGVYAPGNLIGGNYNNYNRENKFKFKNSLVITPFYETEFNVSGGLKYIKNHDDCVFFYNDSIFALTNEVQKIPVLIKRGINKQSAQKKLIIEEKYNFEEKYEIYKNIILYYEENRIDFQIQFIKLESGNNPKDITTEFSLNLSVPGISEAIARKNFNEKSDSTEYMVIKTGKDDDSCMTLYPDKKLITEYKNKSVNFAVSNISQPRKNYINLKIYLEKYMIT